jgi:hypothetical protein
LFLYTASENPLNKTPNSPLVTAFPTLQEGQDVESDSEEETPTPKSQSFPSTAGASFIDWNEEFQKISALEESAEKYKRLSQIAHEFGMCKVSFEERQSSTSKQEINFLLLFPLF